MIGSYWMVAVNTIASGLLFGGMFIYKYVFPKKNINLFIALILISLLPLISLLRIGTYESGDLSINAIKTMSLYSGFLDGIFFPRWAEALNATYGYPLFTFTYPLPYYIASLFHFLGFSFIASLKLLLFFSVVFSGVAMYFWIKDLFGKIPGFVAAIFYLFVPYHLVDMHFRVDIGETLSFVFLPLTLLFARKVIKEGKFRWIILEIVSIAVLILSHQAVSLSFIPFLGAYTLFEFFNQKKREIISLGRFFFSFILSLSLSAFYWMPAVFEGIYTKRDEFSSVISFVNLPELLFSPWRFGLLFQGPKGELSYIIGYAQWIVVLVIIFFIFKNRIKNSYQKRLLILLISAFILFLIMMLPISSPIWNAVPLIKNFQFTSRLLVIEALLTSAMAGILVKNINNKLFIYALCFIAIFTTILNWGNRRTIPEITDSTLMQNLPLSTAAGEGLQPAVPKWVNSKQIWMDVVPKQHLEVLSGNATVKQTFRNSVLHEYTVIVNTKSYLKENTLYFPGWNVYANGKRLEMNYQNPKFPGVITFNLDRGEYNLKLSFEDTFIVSISEWISILTLAGIGIVLSSKLIRP